MSYELKKPFEVQIISPESPFLNGTFQATFAEIESVFQSPQVFRIEMEKIDCEQLYYQTPRKILFSGNRTIVFWQDGTKTIVKRPDNKEHDEYQAFTAALAIKIYGSNSKLKKIIEETKEYQQVEKKGNANE